MIADVSSAKQPSSSAVEAHERESNHWTKRVPLRVRIELYEIFRWQIGETTAGRYALTARGLSGIDFHQSKEIDYVHKSHSVFIQTDRAIYKPGHKVMFRCLILDSRLRPGIVGPTDVYIVVSIIVERAQRAQRDENLIRFR